MKTLTLAGVVLILLGVAGLAYGQFSYTTEETIVAVGPLEATAETRESVTIPSAAGWAGIGLGAMLLLVGLTALNESRNLGPVRTRTGSRAPHGLRSSR